MRKILPLLFLSFLLTASVAARAAPEITMAPSAPDEAVAQELKRNIESEFAWYSEIAQAAGQGLQATGAVQITAKDKYYAVKIPGVSALTGTGFKLDIGDLVINAKPGAAAGEWILSIALPPAMTLFDAAGKPVADVTLGSQKLAASWMPDLDFFPKYDLDYHDVTVKPRTGTPFTVTIGQFAARQNLVRQQDGEFTGPTVYEINNVSTLFTGSDHTSIKLDKAESRGSYEKLSLDDRKGLKERVRLLISQSVGANRQEQLRAAILDIINNAAGRPDTFTTGASFSGFTLDANSARKTTDTADQSVHLALDRLQGEIALTGLKQARGSASLAGNFSGLKITGLPPSLAALLPYVGNVEARADNVPMKELGKATLSILSAAAENLQDPAIRLQASKSMQGTLSVLPQQLAGAGTAIEIKNTYLRATDLNVALEAQFTSNAASPVVAVGGLTLTIGGLDEMVNRYQAMSASPEAMSYVQMMIPFEMMGRQEKGPDGKMRRVYKLELSPEGKLLMNGLDINMAQQLMKQLGTALPETKDK